MPMLLRATCMKYSQPQRATCNNFSSGNVCQGASSAPGHQACTLLKEDEESACTQPLASIVVLVDHSFKEKGHSIRHSITSCGRSLEVAHAMRGGKLLAICPWHL